MHAQPVSCTRHSPLADRSGLCLLAQTTSCAVDQTAAVQKTVDVKLRIGPKFCQEGRNEICALLRLYAAYGGTFLPTFRYHYHHTLHNIPEERRSHLFRGWNHARWNKVTILRVKTESRHRNWEESVCPLDCRNGRWHMRSVRTFFTH